MVLENKPTLTVKPYGYKDLKLAKNALEKYDNCAMC